MSDCCSTNTPSNANDRKHTCPGDGKEYHRVDYTTVIHHLATPWQDTPKEQNYYFCDSPDCDVVYFGQDDSTINKDRIRTTVGVKERSEDAMICYCFDVTRRQAQEDPRAKAFIIEQTKNGSCSCATNNPSGKCCLKDFK